MSGLGACAASLAQLSNFQLNDSADVFWPTGRNAQFTFVEMNIAIIVACATSFSTFFPRIRSLGSSVYNSAVSLLLSTRGAPKAGQTAERLQSNRSSRRLTSQHWERRNDDRADILEDAQGAGVSY